MSEVSILIISSFRTLGYRQGRQSNQVNQCICTTTFSAPPRKFKAESPCLGGKNNPEIPFPARSDLPLFGTDWRHWL